MKSLFIALFLIFNFNLAFAEAPSVPMLTFYLGQMIFDPGINITSVEDKHEYFQVKGKAKTQIDAYNLAVKLLNSRLLREYKFVDVVPFWENGVFTYKLLNKREEKKNVTIEKPLIRDLLKDKIYLSGKCHNVESEIVISGDIQGTANCTKGIWNITLNISSLKIPIIGIQVSQGLKPKISTDYRSFLLPYP